MVEIIRSILSFIPFLFVMFVKVGMHNSSAATAASLGAVEAAAHTALFAIAMLCFTFGDVGSSLAQAYLPSFFKPAKSSGMVASTTGSASGSSSVSKSARAVSSFNLDAARPTIAQLVRCTVGISATVVGIATAVILLFSKQITPDVAVVKQMRRVLPLMVTTLTLHGSAVTLEGLMLAKQDFRALVGTYTFVGSSILALQLLVRRCGGGLLGVWAVYVWFQLSRVLIFLWRGGLLKPSKMSSE